MPLYEYSCGRCSGSIDLVRPIAQRDEPIACFMCQAPLTRQITDVAMVKIQGGGTRNRHKIKMWSIEDRLNAKYGDNE